MCVRIIGVGPSGGSEAARYLDEPSDSRGVTPFAVERASCELGYSSSRPRAWRTSGNRTMTKKPGPDKSRAPTVETPDSGAINPLRYDSYLQLDKLLSAQQPVSKAPEHD